MGRSVKVAKTPGFPGKVLEKNSGDPVDMEIFRSFIEKLIHSSTKVGLNISNARREMAQHMSNPNKALERIVGYLKRNSVYGIILRKPNNILSVSYTDLNYATDKETRRSVSSRINKIRGMLSG